MKNTTRIVIYSAGGAASIIFLLTVAGVDLLIAPIIIAIVGTGIYGHWLRDEAQIKFLMGIIERNEWQLNQDPPARLRLDDPSFSNLPDSCPGISKISLEGAK